MNGRVGCVSIPLHLCHRELRCDVVVVDKNCEAILARAPALAVPFFTSKRRNMSDNIHFSKRSYFSFDRNWNNVYNIMKCVIRA